MDSTEPAIYEIRISGHLDEQWLRVLEGMNIIHLADGVTALVGPVPDQAALYGLLSRIRDLGVPLLSVQRQPTEEPIDE